MKKASITEAKNSLSALIDGLRSGTPVLIVDRGRPVARLEPVTAGPLHDATGRLAGLIRDGIVRAGRTSVSKTVLAAVPPKPTRAVSAVRALIDERRTGR